MKEDEYFQEVPDRPFGSGDDVGGVTSSPMGSFVPEGSYRPLPIVWFAAVLLIQPFVSHVVTGVLHGQSFWIVAAGLAIATLLLGYWTFSRGMSAAGTGWKVATALAILLIFALFTLEALFDKTV